MFFFRCADTGWLCDYTKSFDATFYLAGYVILFSGLMLLAVPFLHHCEPQIVKIQERPTYESDEPPAERPTDSDDEPPTCRRTHPETVFAS